MTEENFSVLKCANCGGWGTIGKIGKTCPSCKGKGVLIIDNFTGETIDPIKDIQIDEDENKQII